MIPFMDLDAQYRNIQDEIDEAVFRVIRSYKFINGPDVQLFEENFAGIQEVKHCIGCSNGTSALHIAYEILGISAGDEVIVPTMTFIATTEPLHTLGAVPVFADIDPLTYNIDTTKIESLITARTRAIVAVHLHGNPADMLSIRKIADKYDLKVIEDCAQAHLAEIETIKVGNFSDIATFSFYPGKNLGAYGDAGAIVTNNDNFAAKARLLVDHGRTEKYVHQHLGYNYRLDTIQAAILNVKLKYLPAWTEKRIGLASFYSEKLAGYGLQLPASLPESKHVFHIYAIKTDKRDKIAKELKENHIAYGIHYPIPLHLQPAYSFLNYKAGSLPVAENMSQQFISLPLYAEMSDFQLFKVIDTVRKSL